MRVSPWLWFSISPSCPVMQLSLARTPMSKCRYAGFSALRMCTEFPGISPPGTGGVGGSGSMPYLSLQGGLSMGGCFFSYKPRTPGSGGVVHRGGHFQIQTAYSRFRGGVVHRGGHFQLRTAYSRFRRGGCPWGGHFQLQTAYSRFRGGGLSMGGVIFSYKPRTPGSGDENRRPNKISLWGQVQTCVQIFPDAVLGGCVPPGC